MSELAIRSEGQALAAIDEARKLIATAREAGDTATLLDWRDKAAAVQHYARTRDEASGLADDAGEIKLRAEAALGQLDAEANPHGGDRAEQGSATGTLPPVRRETRAAWRKLGKLDEAQLDAVVERLRTDELRGITTASAVRLARDLYEPSHTQDSERVGRRQAREAFTIRLHELRHPLRWLDQNVERVARDASAHDLDRWTVQVDEAAERLARISTALKRGGDNG
jgi:hypothetical protein